jgi:hypothetical protein
VKKKYDAAKERLENDVKEITELIQVHDKKTSVNRSVKPVKLKKYEALTERLENEVKETTELIQVHDKNSVNRSVNLVKLKKYKALTDRLENDEKEIPSLFRYTTKKNLSIDQSTPVKLNKYDAAKDRPGSERDHGMSK